MNDAKLINTYDQAVERLRDFCIKVQTNGSNSFLVTNAEDNEGMGGLKLWREFNTVAELSVYADALEDAENGSINRFDHMKTIKE